MNKMIAACSQLVTVFNKHDGSLSRETKILVTGAGTYWRCG